MSETMTITAIENTTVPDAHRLIEGRDELGRKASWDVPAATFQRFTEAGGKVGATVTIYDDGGFLIVSMPPAPDTAPPSSPAPVPQEPEAVAAPAGEATPAALPSAKPARAATKPKSPTSPQTPSKAKAPAKKPGPKPKPKAVHHVHPS